MVAPVGQNGAETGEEERVPRLPQERDADQIEGKFEPVRPSGDGTSEVGGVAMLIIEVDDEIEQRLRVLPLPQVISALRRREGAVNEGLRERSCFGAEILRL